MPKLPIIVLISGNGTTLQAIIDKCSRHVEILCVISDNPTAYGLTRARLADIPTFVLEQEEGETRKEYCERLIQWMKPHQAELVALAGFMKFLTANYVKAFPRTLNIHPSLLPQYKGLHTYRRVLQSNDKYHGVTIHWVNDELDGGPRIWQRSYKVLPEDTEETLEAKGRELERFWYPRMINLAANSDI